MEVLVALDRLLPQVVAVVGQMQWEVMQQEVPLAMAARVRHQLFLVHP
jgi:hypothetical protein